MKNKLLFTVLVGLSQIQIAGQSQQLLHDIVREHNYQTLSRVIEERTFFDSDDDTEISITPIHDRNMLHQTLLHVAAQRTTGKDHIKVLCEAGSEINAEDQDGNTPLHIAVQYNRVENAKEFLFFGADKHYKNKEGISPRDLALKEFGAIKTLFEDDDEEDKVLGL